MLTCSLVFELMSHFLYVLQRMMSFCIISSIVLSPEKPTTDVQLGERDTSWSLFSHAAKTHS